MSRSIRFDFNTAITGCDPATGKFDEAAHRFQVLPLRGRIMQCDGIVGLHINRYDLEVSYLEDVTDEATVIKTVEETVTWASTQMELFPLRGDKTPTATCEVITPRQPATRQQVVARFNSHITALPASGKKSGEVDEERFAMLTLPVATALVNLNGVIKQRVYLDCVVVTFKKSLTDAETVQDHVCTTLQYFAAHSAADIFPFLQHPSELEITYEVQDVLGF